MAKQCKRCYKVYANEVDGFYKSNKNPDGYLDLCRVCINDIIDVNDPQSFLPILQEADVPFFQYEWNYVVEISRNHGSVLGRYLSKMRLPAFKKMRYNDGEV